VIRKHMGYGYIASEHAEAMQAFYRQHMNCEFPARMRDARLGWLLS
jgi:hypothetical protein